MAETRLSTAEIEAAARELVMYELSGYPSGHIHTARHTLSPKTDAADIAVHERAARLYQTLTAAAPQVWDEALRIAEATSRTTHLEGF